VTRIVVASGKGGTGKTTVATSLALSLVPEGQLVAGPTPGPGSPLFLDCDVEAPNAHLFLTPTFERREEVGLLIPEVDESRCTF
jgi:MinD superfamily P-loop ATPase